MQTGALPLLEMHGIVKSFPGVRAVKGVSLKVAAGEVVALIGENGAGKSTLMNILGGIHQPDAGEILIDGAPVQMRSVRESNAHGVAFIHQELALLDNLDVAANIYLGREPRRGGALRLIDRGRLNADTAVWLKRLHMPFGPETPVRELSIAHQQMVEVAKALSLQARLIIMDEPTSSLTLEEAQQLFAAIDQLRAQGVSVIYISHRLAEVKTCADRVVALRDGANAGELTREEISHERMIALMVGRELKSFYTPPAREAQRGFLRVEGLRTRAYPSESVSFEAAAGEILGFAGLIGAGRTDVACALFGVEPALAGSVTLDGETLKIGDAHTAMARGIYLIPEDRRHAGLVQTMTIRENFTLPDLPSYTRRGLIDTRRESARAWEGCQALHVKAESAEFICEKLSGGNQQKVVLGKWLAMRPRVLIFDEPTRGIDVNARSEFYGIMRRLADAGTLVLMISSDMEEILGVSDRIIVMHEGRITATLERGAFDEETIMRHATGIDMQQTTTAA